MSGTGSAAGQLIVLAEADVPVDEPGHPEAVVQVQVPGLVEEGEDSGPGALVVQEVVALREPLSSCAGGAKGAHWPADSVTEKYRVSGMTLPAS